MCDKSFDEEVSELGKRIEILENKMLNRNGIIDLALFKNRLVDLENIEDYEALQRLYDGQRVVFNLKNATVEFSINITEKFESITSTEEMKNCNVEEALFGLGSLDDYFYYPVSVYVGYETKQVYLYGEGSEKVIKIASSIINFVNGNWDLMSE